MGNFRIVLAGLAVLLLAGCGSAVTMPAEPTVGELSTVQIQTEAPANLPTSGPSKTINSTPVADDSCPEPYSLSDAPRDQYRLEACLDVSQHTLQVDETIAYTNRTADPLTELVLVVEPNRYADVFQLDSVAVAGIAHENFSLNQLRFNFIIFMFF